MEARSFTTVDKTGWGDGPWQSEPDKMQWKDEVTGLPCLIVRGPLGSLCGYVGVPPAHPAHGLSHDGTPDAEHKAYHKALRAKLRWPLMQGGEKGHEAVRAALEDSPERPEPSAIGEQVLNLNVHGGLTFAGGCQEGADPAVGVCHIPEPGEPDDVWWLGFDCSHAGDLAPMMEVHRKEMDARMPMPPILKHFRDAHPDVYRDIAYVQGQVAELAKQLVAIHV